MGGRSWVGPRPFIDFNLNLDVHFCGVVDAGLFDVQPVAKSASAFMSICVRMSTGPITHWQQYWLLTGCMVWCIHMTADVYRFWLGVQAHGTLRAAPVYGDHFLIWLALARHKLIQRGIS